MINPEQTRHVQSNGTFVIPENLRNLVDPVSFENILSHEIPSEKSVVAHYVFRDMKPEDDPVPRPEGNWPSSQLINFFSIAVSAMVSDGLPQFQGAFPQAISAGNESNDWSSSLNIAEEFRSTNGREADDATHETLYREYGFRLAKSTLPDSSERLSVSIRRINLPKGMRGLDFASSDD